MPAYYTVGFQYERAATGTDYLRSLYSAMIQGNFVYAGVLAWGCPGDLSLEEVIRWNQERFDRDFELGYTGDVSNDYRQILLAHPQYSECRVIIMNESRFVSVIVPEDDVFSIGGPFPVELSVSDPEPLARYLCQEQVEPLRQLALAVWHRKLAVSVQTYGELGEGTDTAALTAGEPPSMLPFAIVPSDWIGTASLSGGRVRISPVGETGLLLERTHD